VYLTDFALALSTQFTLAADEAAFLVRHRDFDRADALTRLAWSLAAATTPGAGQDTLAILAHCANAGSPPGLPRRVAELLESYAPLALVMIDWLRAVQNVSRDVPYPADEVRALMTNAS